MSQPVPRLPAPGATHCLRSNTGRFLAWAKYVQGDFALWRGGMWVFVNRPDDRLSWFDPIKPEASTGTTAQAGPKPNHADMLKQLNEFQFALAQLPKQEEGFIYLFSPEAADRLAKLCPAALTLPCVKVDRLGVVTPGRYIKVPDVRKFLGAFPHESI